VIYPRPVAAATSYYVNDNSIAGDVYCSAIGDNANSGTSPSAPKLTIQAIINGYTLGTGDVVYIDTGAYGESISITTADEGATLQGAGPGKSTINGTTSSCIYMNQVSGMTITGFTITCGVGYPFEVGGFVRNYGGGIGLRYSTSTITNCIISGNSTIFGGGIYSKSSTLTITNCTVTGNTGTVNVGGIYTVDGTSTITNCIIWGNSGSEVYNSGGTNTVTYCDVQGGYTGTGNINQDPLFVGGGDYHLQSEAGHWTSTSLGDRHSDEPVYRCR